MLNLPTDRLTDKGIVKYSTDCAPNNGYYFIPLYDRGQYQIAIEPPHGWTFDPMTVDLDFDGKTDLCSQQQDINFSFKGFTISGKVWPIIFGTVFLILRETLYKPFIIKNYVSLRSSAKDQTRVRLV